MTGQRVGYARVSTQEQNTERQLTDIKLDRVFTDHASGKDTSRPQLTEMLAYVRDGDTVIVHSMDRLARSLDDLRRLVRDLTERGVAVEFSKEALIFRGDDSAISTLLLNMMGAVAEFELSHIRSRQREGIEQAKKRGVYKGRANALNHEQAAEVCRRAAAGEQRTALAKEFGISRESLYRYLRAG